jgi:hypothetical protein
MSCARRIEAAIAEEAHAGAVAGGFFQIERGTRTPVS